MLIIQIVFGRLLTVAGFVSSMNCRRLKTMGWMGRPGIGRGRTRRIGRSIRSNLPRPETLSHGQSLHSYEENSPEKKCFKFVLTGKWLFYSVIPCTIPK